MQEKIYTLEEALSLGARANLANHERYVNPALAKMMSLLAFDRPFARAEGMYVWDQEGNRYLDFLGATAPLTWGTIPRRWRPPSRRWGRCPTSCRLP